jgi:prepilin-type N-terminal cleavage/methylation domain-containing protein
VRPAPARRPPGTEGGLTLVELLVVVLIIGVIAGAAAVVIRSGPGIGDAAARVSGMVAEAARKAVAGGPVRANVAAGGNTSRARVRFDVDPNGFPFVAVDRRVEDSPDTATTFEWVELTRARLPDRVAIAGLEPVPRTDPGGAPTVALPFTVECEPGGTCDAATIYLETTGGAPERKRVVVMPLGAAPLVFDQW